jgi:L-asparaginase
MTHAPDGGVSPALSAADLLSAVPGLSGIEAELRTVDFRRKPGASVSFTDLFELAGAINGALRDGCAGVVITQGTDTIEEVAYALDLMLSGDAPAVVTGAMRNPTMAGADGPAPGRLQRPDPRGTLGAEDSHRKHRRLRLARARTDRGSV